MGSLKLGNYIHVDVDIGVVCMERVKSELLSIGG